MNRLFLFSFVLITFIGCNTNSLISYEGVIQGHNFDFGTIAVLGNFTVQKSFRNDSVVWDYKLKHDGDSTLYEVKYSKNENFKFVMWHENNYELTDSLVCHGEKIFIFDAFSLKKTSEVAYFFVSAKGGLLSVGSFNHADFLEI